MIFGACGALSRLPLASLHFFPFIFAPFPLFALGGQNFTQKSLTGGFPGNPPSPPRGGLVGFGYRKSPKIWLYGSNNNVGLGYPAVLFKITLWSDYLGK